MRFNMNLLRSGNLVTRTVAQISLVAVVAAVSTSAVSTSAFATLDSIAYNVTPQTISSGTLLDSITAQTSSSIGQGFAASLANMNPGDTRTVVIDYFNYGTDSATSLTLSANFASNTLTNDAARGLQLVVSSCTSPWTYTISSFSACSGSLTVIATPMSAFSTAATNIAFTGSPTVAANAHLYLKFAFGLPATSSEMWANGAFVANSGAFPGSPGIANSNPATTITGLNASVTWVVHATAVSASGSNNA